MSEHLVAENSICNLRRMYEVHFEEVSLKVTLSLLLFVVL
jgi:hypothetical protein